MAVLCLAVSTKEITMKVRLINDGGYYCMNEVKFPVIVDAKYFNKKVVDVSVAELRRVGAKGEILSKLSFIVGRECEVIE